MATWKVEVSFSTNPLDTPSWTDITPYCYGYKFQRGRNSELGRFATGTGSIRLDNTDRRFEPLYAASPYYPNVLAMRRVRKSLSGTVVFTGLIPRWPVQQDAAGYDSVIDVPTVDLQYALAQSLILLHNFPQQGPGSPAGVGNVLADGGNRNGATLGNAVIGGAWVDTNGTGYTTADYGSGVLWVTPGASAGIHYLNAGISDGTLRARHVWQVGGSTAATEYNGLYVRLSDANNWFWVTLIKVDDPPYMKARIYKSVAGVITLVDSQNVVGAGPNWSVDNEPYGGLSLSVIVAGNTLQPVVLYHDASGNAQTFTAVAYTDSFNNTATRFGFGRPAGSSWLQGYTEFSFVGVVAATGHPRANEILNTINWPAADRVIATGTVTMAAAAVTQICGLDVLLQLEEAEQGQVYVDKLGRVVFEDNLTRTTQARSKTPQAVFGDGGGAEIPYTKASFYLDETNLVNVISAQGAGSFTPYTLKDQASIDKYLTHTLSYVYAQSDAAGGLSTAKMRLNRYREPVFRAEPLALDGNNAAELAALVAAEISDLVTLYRRPNAGTAVNATAVNAFVEQIQIEVVGIEAKGAVTLSPQRLSSWPVWDTAIWDTDVWGP